MSGRGARLSDCNGRFRWRLVWAVAELRGKQAADERANAELLAQLDAMGDLCPPHAPCI